MIAVLDYGFGNVRSVQRAVERVGGRPEITSDPGVVERAGDAQFREEERLEVQPRLVALRLADDFALRALVLDGGDVNRAIGTMFETGPRAKYFDFPSAVYATLPYDKVMKNGKVIGISTWCGYTANEGVVFA